MLHNHLHKICLLYNLLYMEKTQYIVAYTLKHQNAFLAHYVPI